VLKPMLVLLTLFVSTVSPQQPPAAPAKLPIAIPAEAASMVNPVKPTPEAQAYVKKMYGYDCAMCHGATGDGKGDVAVQDKLSMKDFTDPATLSARTDGELFYIIKTGMGDKMPPEGDRLKTDQLWNMVILMRSFPKK
jgi:mono/diheme cytochrome c family protein